jgi:hypothetical protein
MTVADFMKHTKPARYEAEEWRVRLRHGRRFVEVESATTELELMALPLSTLLSAH